MIKQILILMKAEMPRVKTSLFIKERLRCLSVIVWLVSITVRALYPACIAGEYT